MSEYGKKSGKLYIGYIIMGYSKKQDWIITINDIGWLVGEYSKDLIEFFESYEIATKSQFRNIKKVIRYLILLKSAGATFDELLTKDLLEEVFYETLGRDRKRVLEVFKSIFYYEPQNDKKRQKKEGGAMKKIDLRKYIRDEKTYEAYWNNIRLLGDEEAIKRLIGWVKLNENGYLMNEEIKFEANEEEDLYDV